MNLYDRLKKWRTARKIKKLTSTPTTLEAWTPEDLRKLANLKEAEQTIPSQGSGDGAFLPDMTQDEYLEYLRDETHGWKGFYNRVTGRQPIE